MDGHAKGGGALSAVSATKSPIIFLGTGPLPPDSQLEEKQLNRAATGQVHRTGLVPILKEAANSYCYGSSA